MLQFPKNTYGREFQQSDISVRSDVSSAAAQPPSDVAPVIIAGRFASGQPGFQRVGTNAADAIQQFTNLRAIRESMGGMDAGDEADIADGIMNPGQPDDTDVQGPARAMLYRLGTPTRALHTVINTADAAKDYYQIDTKQYGPNDFQMKRAVGTTASTYYIAFRRFGSQFLEEWDNIGKAILVQYTESGSPAATCVLDIVDDGAAAGVANRFKLTTGGANSGTEKDIDLDLTDPKFRTVNDVVKAVNDKGSGLYTISLLDSRISDMEASKLDQVAAVDVLAAAVTVWARNEAVAHIVTNRSTSVIFTLLSDGAIGDTSFADFSSGSGWENFGTLGTYPANVLADYTLFLQDMEDNLVQFTSGPVVHTDLRPLTAAADADAHEQTAKKFAADRRAENSLIFRFWYGQREALAPLAQDATVITKAAALSSQDVRIIPTPCTIRSLGSNGVNPGTLVDIDGTYVAALAAGMDAGSGAREPMTLKRLKVSRLRREYTPQAIHDLTEAGVTIAITEADGPKFHIGVTTAQEPNRLLSLCSNQGKLYAIETEVRRRTMPLRGKTANLKLRGEWLMAVRGALERYLDIPGQDGFLSDGLNGPAYYGLSIDFDQTGLVTVNVTLNIADEIDWANINLFAQIQRFRVAPQQDVTFALAA